MSLKVKGRAQKYWAIVSALLCGVLPKECWTLLKGNPPNCRTRLYFEGVVVGILLLFIFFLYLLPFLLRFSFFKENEVLQSALAVLILTFPSVTINWLIKNRDVSQQLEYSRQQQNETLFSNSLQSLFKKEDGIANSVGLKELVKLKQEGRIDSKRIDLITSSGLQIEKASLKNANLQGADLQEADLQRANLIGTNLQGADLTRTNLLGALLLGTKLLEADLRGADLQEAKLLEADLRGANLQGAYLQKAKILGANLKAADLQWANLQEANLQGANLQGANLQRADLKHSRYDEETQFPDEFDPEQHEMRKMKLT